MAPCVVISTLISPTSPAVFSDCLGTACQTGLFPRKESRNKKGLSALSSLKRQALLFLPGFNNGLPDFKLLIADKADDLPDA